MFVLSLHFLSKSPSPRNTIIQSTIHVTRHTHPTHASININIHSVKFQFVSHKRVTIVLAIASYSASSFFSPFNIHLVPALPRYNPAPHPLPRLVPISLKC
ncbi:hypothetical protein CY34DRAFT_525596 [Suillus luteus UH-Slu-Lm8-n1]|uniref:Uncharacterized protein n=1 Tax=Suillus luteus UH-Slu-Lm8-n1 TaxID=930992 RepID=A0A0D0AWV6_9AGAM|nr:hypothetical protein CY34DRAFT_525596 [Suillus luteus UH-Slu-Lm8-n1]